MFIEKLTYEYKPFWTLLIADRSSIYLDSPLAKASAIVLFSVSLVLVWERYRHRVLLRSSLRKHSEIRAQLRKMRNRRERGLL